MSDDLVYQALNNPTVALEAATEVLRHPPSEAAAVTSLRARGLANRTLGNFDESARDLAEALRRADAINDDELWAGAGLSLAGTWVFQGRVEDARALLERCIERSSGESHIEAICQLGTTCAQAGDFDQAMDHYGRALPLIQEIGRSDWEADLLGNRGAIHIYQGRYDAAIDDLDRAISMVAEHGPSLYSLHRGNKAYALHLRGDIALAIDLYEENERFQQQHGLPTLMYAQRCTALVAAGMYEDAMVLAQQAHRFHNDGRAVLGALEALLPGAEAALALGHHELTHKLARSALELDEKNSFPTFTARARLAMVEARFLAGAASSLDIAESLRLHNLLKDSNSSAAARSLLVGASIAIKDGDTKWAGELLELVGEHAARAPLHVQIERFKLAAELHVLQDEHRDAASAVAAGLELFDDLVEGVAAYDVRYKAARHAEALARQALTALLNHNELAAALAMVERVRAGAVRVDDRQTVVGETVLRSREINLTWIELGDHLACLVDDGNRILLSECGDIEEIAGLVDRHAFAHRQLARRSNLGQRAFRALVAEAAAADIELAAAILPGRISDRVILSPSSALQPILWGALPGLAERCHVVSPSRAIAHRMLPHELSSAFVVGSTDLAHVAEEVADIAAMWGAAAHMDPSPDVLDDIDGVSVLHAAGHFVNESENPLLSSMPLGPSKLRGHEYLQLKKPPEIAVLSACASGQGSTVAGAQVGFASAALAAGTTSVIVTQTLIEDGDTIVSAMKHLHQLLRQGIGPAAALQSLRLAATLEDRSTIASLGVIGTGWRGEPDR